MALITSLCLLLLSAHALGRLAVFLKQPALAGHMIAGVLLGPSVLAWLQPNIALGAASEISVLFVVLTAGLEMRLQHVLAAFRGRGSIVMLIGFLVPALAGGGVAFAFGIYSIPALVVALCVAVTALPIALQILESFGLLQTRIARLAIAGALLSDLLVFMILGVISEAAHAGDRETALSILYASAKLAGLIVTVLAAQWVCVRLAQRFRHEQRGDFSIANLTFAMLFVLALGSASELLGFHFAIGAFFAAMMITPELMGERSFARLGETCETLTASWFGPLFLAYQGVQFQLQALQGAGFLIALTIAAVLGKLLSGYLMARMQRMGTRDAWGVGIVMNARGVMELVIASIAYRAGLINAEIFSVLLALGLITTALTPLLLQRWLNSARTSGNESIS